jgi:RHS repeat-associated protein
VDANNKLLEVNHGVNAVPTSGQAGAYLLFGYDLNGNTIHRERRFEDGTFQSHDLDWDGADNLAQISVHGGPEIFSAGYNGDGLRTTMQDTARGSFPTEHDFSWGLGGLLYDTYQSAVYTPGVSQRVNGVDSYFHTDWLGSTRYLSDDTGTGYTGALRYDAFGNRTDASTPYDPTPFRFAGDWGYQSPFASGPEDGPGLLYLQQRYYDPAVGRFINRDPIGFDAGPNLYQYVGNDPVNFADPTGLQLDSTRTPQGIQTQIELTQEDLEEITITRIRAIRQAIRQFAERRGVNITSHAARRVFERCSRVQDVVDIFKGGGGYWNPRTQSYILYSSRIRQALVVDRLGNVITVLRQGPKPDWWVPVGRGFLK